MYIALGILIGGMIAGRLLRGQGWLAATRRGVFPAVLLLLFLLGVAVGGNAALVRELPRLGGGALLLMLGGVGGSVFCVCLLRPLFARQSPRAGAAPAPGRACVGPECDTERPRARATERSGRPL